MRGAGGGSRTPVTSLENWSNSRYTTPALLLDVTDKIIANYRCRLTLVLDPDDVVQVSHYIGVGNHNDLQAGLFDVG